LGLLSVSVLNTACHAEKARAPGTGATEAKEIAPGVKRIGFIEDPRITESSGVVASRQFPGVFWTHNDGPKSYTLFAIDRQGKSLASFQLAGAFIHDWEDIAIDSEELDEATQAIDVRELSPIGKRLAQAYAASISRTKYVTERWALKNSVSASVLEQFGARSGLCELSLKSSIDRSALRNMFFSKDGFLAKESHYRRRMSLLLLIECIGRAHSAGISFDNSSFSDFCYFGEILLEDESGRTSVPVALPESLRDIAHRWRIFLAKAISRLRSNRFSLAASAVYEESRRVSLGRICLMTILALLLTLDSKSYSTTNSPKIFLI